MEGIQNRVGVKSSRSKGRLYRKEPGEEERLCFMGHVLMGTATGLVVNVCLTEANGNAE